MRKQLITALIGFAGCHHAPTGSEMDPVSTPVTEDVSPLPSEPATTQGACGEQTYAISAGKAQPNVMLVIDRSGSMAYPATTSKWDALKVAAQSLLTQYSDQARWGLALFPKRASASCTSGEVDLAISASSQASDILNIINPIMSVDETNLMPGNRAESDPLILGHGTPTPQTLTAVRDANMFADATREHAIILMTDGIPNCSGTEAQSAADTTAIIAALAAQTPPVKTYVVGLGDGANSHPDALNAWAVAGLTARVGQPTQYYTADSTTDLQTAFHTIAGELAACSYKLATPVVSIDDFTVSLDGNVIAFDAANGVSYDAATQSLIFHGASCASIQTGKVQAIKTSTVCPTATVQIF